MASRERLTSRPELPLWIGKDLSLEEDILVEPRSFANSILKFSHEDVPEFVKNDPSNVKHIRASVRSRYAQLGLEVYDPGAGLHEYLIDNPHHFQLEEELWLHIPVYNHSARAIRLAQGSRLFRPWYQGLSRIEGIELERMLSNGESGPIFIDGIYGVDWKWAYEARGRKKVGIYVKIADENRKWLPYNGGEPVEIDDSSGIDFRSELDKYLKPVPEFHNTTLWIGETKPRMKLGDSVLGILHPAAMRTIDEKVLDFEHLGSQTNSHIIDPQSNWQIRLEIISKTLRSEMPNYVYFSFVKLD